MHVHACVCAQKHTHAHDDFGIFILCDSLGNMQPVVKLLSFNTCIYHNNKTKILHLFKLSWKAETLKERNVNPFNMTDMSCQNAPHHFVKIRNLNKLKIHNYNKQPYYYSNLNTVIVFQNNSDVPVTEITSCFQLTFLTHWCWVQTPVNTVTCFPFSGKQFIRLYIHSLDSRNYQLFANTNVIKTEYIFNT